MLETKRKESAFKKFDFTKREEEVAFLMADSMSVDQIAEKLHIQKLLSKAIAIKFIQKRGSINKLNS